MDPIFCNASVDFNVPGKPNPPPISLTATVWVESHFLPTGTEKKHAIEFSDPSGTLASPSVPLNTWVQLNNMATQAYPGPAPTRCLPESRLVFQDQHDGDRKVVTLSGNHMTILPFDSGARLPTNFCAYDSILSFAIHLLSAICVCICSGF